MRSATRNCWRDQTAASRLCRGALAGTMEDGSLASSGEPKGVRDQSRIWWVQAEAMTGLLNEYERSGHLTMLAIAEPCRYIEAHIFDGDGGEWFGASRPTARRTTVSRGSMPEGPLSSGSRMPAMDRTRFPCRRDPIPDEVRRKASQPKPTGCSFGGLPQRMRRAV